MILDERQYQGFLEELHDLKKFQQDYPVDNPAARVNWDDPDVQRIIEALAFFGARTHLAAQRSLEGTQQRLYQQFFPYFLTPLPATGMIQAKPTAQLTEDLVLDVGTEFELQPEKGGSGMFFQRGFNCEPQTPNPKSQSLSQSYRPNLPTSLTYNHIDQRLFTLET